jgi:LacI family transcriptional regulator
VNDPKASHGNGHRLARPTMRDVAALAGVGLMTVSRVVNGEPGVSPDRAARVREAVEKLDYRHNVAARQLRLTGQPSALIGVVLEDVANPFVAALQRAVEDEVTRQGCVVLSGSSGDDPERERALVAAFAARRVDGLIMMPHDDDVRYLLPEMRRGTPVVFVDRPAASVATDTVVSDNYGGARLAVEHLLAAGHRRIGFLGALQAGYTASERYRGYQAALAAAGIPADERLAVQDLHTSQAGQRAARELLTAADPPTALFTAQNLLTIGARRAMDALGLQDRVAQVGFDDIALADLLKPGLTVVAQDPAAIGALAATLLIRRINGAEQLPEKAEVPVRLIPRGSGEIPAP